MRATVERGARALALPGLYTAAAVVATWPATGRFASAFFSTGLAGNGEAAPGDHLQTAYRFWLVGHQLERGAAPWRDPYSFQPLAEPQPNLGGWPFGLPFWPLEAAFGPVVAWNVLLIAVAVGAGLFTYAWLRTLELPRVAAAVGGLAFTLAPYRLAQSGGHLLGWIAILLPLSLWAYERSRAAGSTRDAHAWGALAAASLVSIPLSGQLHLALGAVPLLLAYAAVRFRAIGFGWLAGAAVGALAVGLLVRVAVIAASVTPRGRTLEEVDRYSVRWVDFVSRSRLDGLERFVYLGWLVPVLAGAGLVMLARRRRGLALVLGLAALVPVLLALGTNLPLYSAVRELVPPLQYPRVPARFVPIANLALAALAAVALAALLARASPRVRPWAAALALALVAADLLVFPLRSSVADPGNAAYAALAEAPAGRVLELPLFEPGEGHSSVYHYYAMQGPRERPTGYSTLAPREAYEFAREFNRLDCGAVLPGDLAALRDLGVRYAVVHLGLYEQTSPDATWFALRALEAEGIRPIASDGRIWLFGPGAARIPPPRVPEPDRGEPVFCDGWRKGLVRYREAAVWLYGGGRLDLALATERPTRISVWFDGVRVHDAPATTAVRVEAETHDPGWHSLVVRQEIPRAGLTIERLRWR